jgi:hypothetical protein
MARLSKIYSDAATARYRAYGDKWAKRAIMSQGIVKSWFAGEPVEGPLSRDRRLQNVGYTIWWRDEITPATMMWDVGIDLAGSLPSTALQDAIPKHIRKIYDMGGDPRWKPSQKMGRVRRMKRKGKESVLSLRGERTMSRTGNLARVVHQLPLHIRVYKFPPSALTRSRTQTIVMTGLDEGFAEAPYVWYHEMGTKKTPRRPFVFQGVQRGWNEAVDAINFGYKAQFHLAAKKSKEQPTTRLIAAPVSPARPVPVPVAAQMQLYEAREKMTAFALMWWLLPPSQAWAVMGGTSDVMAVLSGDMLQARYLIPWLQALVQGKLGTMAGIPLTKKTARRGFRRKMYRGRGKYRKK